MPDASSLYFSSNVPISPCNGQHCFSLRTKFFFFFNLILSVFVDLMLEHFILLEMIVLVQKRGFCLFIKCKQLRDPLQVLQLFDLQKETGSSFVVVIAIFTFCLLIVLCFFSRVIKALDMLLFVMVAEGCLLMWFVTLVYF